MLTYKGKNIVEKSETGYYIPIKVCTYTNDSGATKIMQTIKAILPDAVDESKHIGTITNDNTTFSYFIYGTKSSIAKWVFNKNNYKDTIKVVLDGVEYTLSGMEDNGFLLFININTSFNTIPGFAMSIKYTNGINNKMFLKGGAFYDLIQNHKMKLTRQSDEYGLIYPHNAVGITDYDPMGALLLWDHKNAIAATNTTDSVDTIAKNIVSYLQNGDTIVVEFLND